MPTKRPSSSAPPEPGSNRRASQDSQPSTQSRIMKRWTPNEEIYLIAAIDYCIDNDVSPEHAIPAILADVQQNSEGTRSWGSIVSKIRSLNEKFHVNKTFAVHPLLEKGSKCLNLSSEMRKAVKVARDSIIQRLEPISPENSPSDGSFFHPSENDADAALSISVKHPVSRGKGSSQRLGKKDKEVPGSTHLGPERTDDQDTNSMQPPSSLGDLASMASEIHASFSGHRRSPNDRHESNDIQLPLSKRARTSSETVDGAAAGSLAFQDENCEDPKVLVREFSEHMLTHLESYSNERVRLYEHIKSLETGQNKKITQLKQELSNAKSEIVRMDSEVGDARQLTMDLENEKARRINERVGFEEELGFYRDNIKTKDRQLNEAQQIIQKLVDPCVFKRRIDFPPLYRFDSLNQKWQDLWKAAKGCLNSVSDSTINSEAFLGLASLENGKLLVSLVSGINEDTVDVSNFATCFQQLVDRPTDGDVWRALYIAASLCYVFQKDFYNMGEESSKEERMWEALALQGGLKTVRMTDLLIKQARAKETYFQKKEMPRFAAEMERSQRKALGSMIKEDAELTPWLKFLIQVKCDLILSIESFKLVFIPPRTPFDRDRMIAERSNGFEIDTEDANRYTVKLCVWPGLMGLSEEDFADEYEPGQNYRDALIESKNFLPETPGKYKGWPNESILSKAVVFVEETQS